MTITASQVFHLFHAGFYIYANPARKPRHKKYDEIVIFRLTTPGEYFTKDKLPPYLPANPETAFKSQNVNLS